MTGQKELNMAEYTIHAFISLPDSSVSDGFLRVSFEWDAEDLSEVVLDATNFLEQLFPDKKIDIWSVEEVFEED